MTLFEKQTFGCLLNNFELGVTIISQYTRQLHVFTGLRQKV